MSFGQICINAGDMLVVGANVVVVKSMDEPYTIWGEVSAENQVIKVQKSVAGYNSRLIFEKSLRES